METSDQVREEIEALAREHNVTYERTRLDDVAETFSRLADKEVQLDATQNLIIALRQAEVIDAAGMLDLIRRYVGALSAEGKLPATDPDRVEYTCTPLKPETPDQEAEARRKRPGMYGLDQRAEVQDLLDRLETVLRQLPDY